MSRYVPRIEKGRDLYVLGIRDKIEKKDWEGIAAIFEKVSMAQEDSEKQALGLDIKISKIENELLVPMKVCLPLCATLTRGWFYPARPFSTFTVICESSHHTPPFFPMSLPRNCIFSGVVDVVCGKGHESQTT